MTMSFVAFSSTNRQIAQAPPKITRAGTHTHTRARAREPGTADAEEALVARFALGARRGKKLR